MVSEFGPAFQVAASRRMLARNGCESAVAGHVSLRDEDHESFWVSPFEYFDETLPDTVIRADFSLNLLQGSREPSPAIAFHAAIYKARPDVQSIIHIHSHYVSVFTTNRRVVGMYNARSTLFYGDQALYEGEVDAELVAARLGPNRVLLMKNHGAIVASQSLEQATVDAFTLEEAARYHIEAEYIGGSELDDVTAKAIREKYRKYYHQNMWDANYRRLKKSDPDLFATLA